MDVPLALVADAANMTPDLKLNILGEFNQIRARAFPASHPSMVLVLRFEASPAERGQTKAIDIQLVDDDGAMLFRLENQMMVEHGGPLRFMTIIGLSLLRFEHPGNHAFVIMVGGEPKARVPLELVQVPVEDAPQGADDAEA